jgi:hypothetical protein
MLEVPNPQLHEKAPFVLGHVAQVPITATLIIALVEGLVALFVKVCNSEVISGLPIFRWQTEILKSYIISINIHRNLCNVT